MTMWPFNLGTQRRQERESAQGDLATANRILADHERRIKDLETEYNIITRRADPPYDGPDRRKAPRCS